MVLLRRSPISDHAAGAPDKLHFGRVPALALPGEVHPADMQDRDGAPLVIAAIHDLFPWLRHLFADSAYAGDKLLNTLSKFGNWTIEIVRRMADTIGFEVLPRRWVVERTLAWLNRNRRLAKDFEPHPRHLTRQQVGKGATRFERAGMLDGF